MKTWYLSLIFLLSIAAAAQTKRDSLVFVGVPREPTIRFAEYIQSSCAEADFKDVASPKMFLIIGLKKCKSIHAERAYYHVVYDGSFYYADVDDLATDDKTASQLEGMSSQETEKAMQLALAVDSVYKAQRRIQLLKAWEKAKVAGLMILDWAFSDESEYTSGTSLSFTVYNPTKKTVKYIWFTTVGYNAVNDKVIDPIKRTSAISTKGIGPIGPGESGTYNFEYAWHTDLVQRVVISAVKIQYMDGSFKTITNPRSIILSQELYDEFLTDKE